MAYLSYLESLEEAKVSKETTMERADFTLQLLCNRRKGESNVFNFIYFHFLSGCLCDFKLGHAERVQTNRPRGQLFPIQSL